MAQQPVVVTEKLTKQFGTFTALEDLTLSLDKGQILGFIGPNGAGKTTAIKILVGLARPTRGRAFVCGADCTKDVKKLKSLIGYMPDVFGSYDNMRVHEYLDFFGAAFKIPVRQRSRRIEEVMEITGSTYMKDRFVEALSHGMRQRVSVARTLLHDPQVLILDEPANGLDPQARIEMRQILTRLGEMGKTLIVTSHILPELSRICHKVAIITQGRLRAFGTLDEIMKNVAQQRRFSVQLLRQEDLKTVKGMLAELLEDGAEITSAPNELRVFFATGLQDPAIARVLAHLTAAKVPLSEFAELQVDLEDAFMTVAGLGGSGKSVESNAVGRRQPT